jgi:hypothetical protein
MYMGTIRFRTGSVAAGLAVKPAIGDCCRAIGLMRRVALLVRRSGSDKSGSEVAAGTTIDVRAGRSGGVSNDTSALALTGESALALIVIAGRADVTTVNIFAGLAKNCRAVTTPFLAQVLTFPRIFSVDLGVSGAGEHD